MATNFLNFGTELDRIDANLKALLGKLGDLATLANQKTILENLDEILKWPTVPPEPPRVATQVEICIARFSPKHGGSNMPGSFTVTDDHIAHTTVSWKDDVGPVSPPADAQVVGSDDTVAMVSLSADKKDVDTTPVADGTMSWTVSSPSLGIQDTVNVMVAMPTASSVSADAGGTTFTPKP